MRLSMKRFLPSIVLFVLLASLAYAIDFTVDISPESMVISPNQTAEYNLTVWHDAKLTQFFDIYSPEVLWDVTTDPSTDRNLRVEPRSAKRTVLRVRPLYVQPGYYAVPVNVKLSGTNEVARKNVMVGITRPGQATYDVALRTELVMDAEVDPRQSIPIKVLLVNQNKRTLPKVDVKLRSELVNFDQTTSLSPLEEKELTFDVKLDPMTPEQDDILKITVFTDDKNKTVRFDVPAFKFHVMGYGEIREEVVESESWLVHEKNITFTNTGNIRKNKIARLPISFFDSFFVEASGDAALRKRDDGYEIFWKLTTDPGEPKVLSYKVDYHPLQTSLIVLIVAVLLWYFLRSPIVVRKTSMVVESREGGVSELKVMLRIKNRSAYDLSDLIILDMVPPIAVVQKEFEVGSLRPLKIFEMQGKGSQLKWVMDSLDAKDERILVYRVRTKFSVLGTFRLPPAKVKYRWFGWRRDTMSNVENLFR